VNGSNHTHTPTLTPAAPFSLTHTYTHAFHVLLEPRVSESWESLEYERGSHRNTHTLSLSLSTHTRTHPNTLSLPLALSVSTPTLSRSLSLLIVRSRSFSLTLTHTHTHVCCTSPQPRVSESWESLEYERLSHTQTHTPQLFPSHTYTHSYRALLEPRVSESWASLEREWLTSAARLELFAIVSSAARNSWRSCVSATCTTRQQ